MSDLLVDLGLGYQQSFKGTSGAPRNYVYCSKLGKMGQIDICVGTFITGLE